MGRDTRGSAQNRNHPIHFQNVIISGLKVALRVTPIPACFGSDVWLSKELGAGYEMGCNGFRRPSRRQRITNENTLASSFRGWLQRDSLNGLFCLFCLPVSDMNRTRPSLDRKSSGAGSTSSRLHDVYDEFAPEAVISTERLGVSASWLKQYTGGGKQQQ